MKREVLDVFIPMIETMERIFADILAEEFEGAETRNMIAAAKKHFEKAERSLPSVSPSSPWLKNLIGIAYEIGIWKELAGRGMSLNEISIVNQRVLARLFRESIPSQELEKIRDTLCSVSYTRGIAEDSRKSAYPDDWVFDYVAPGEGDDFQVGMDIHSCPVALLCKNLDAERFFPYFCLNDYVSHGMLGISLVRTHTLAHGAPCCDFRLTSAGKPVADIIEDPLQLPEFKNYPENDASGGSSKKSF